MHKLIAAVLLTVVFCASFILLVNIDFATRAAEVPAAFWLAMALAACVLAVVGGQLYLNRVRVQSSLLVPVFALIETVIFFFDFVNAGYRYPGLFDFQIPALVVALLVSYAVGDILFNGMRLSLLLKIGLMLVCLAGSFWLGTVVVSSCCSVA